MKELSLILLAVTLLAGISVPAFAVEKNVHNAKVVVYYFYDSTRCETCMKIESMTRQITKEHGRSAPMRVDFVSLNIDEKNNTRYLKYFNVEAKIPFAVLYDGRKIVKKTIMDQAWDIYESQASYSAYVTGAIDGLIALGAEMLSERTTTNISTRQAYVESGNSNDPMVIVDVRTPEEYVFLGHPKSAVNIPFKFMKYSWDDTKNRQAMRRNSFFAEEIAKQFDKEMRLAFLCRSGPRSAEAVAVLAEKGYKHLYVIEHGFQGDKGADGKRTVNGWQNENVPWTMQLDAEKMYANDNTCGWYYSDWIAKTRYAPTFQVLDTESSLGAYAEKTKTVTLDDIIKMHGHLCDGLVTAACGLSMGLKELYPDGVIDRTDTSCITNNSPCFGDVAAYLTGGRIRFGTQKIDNRMGNEFILYRISTKQAVKVSLKDGVFPLKLAALEKKVKSGDFTKAEMDLCQKLGWYFAESILNRPVEKCFEVKRLKTFVWKPDDYINMGQRSDVINKNFR